MEGDLLLWTWTIYQWNCICRATNIHTLGFDAFGVHNDALKAEFKSNKGDQAGDKTIPKHIFANPDDPWVDSHLSMAIWIVCSCQELPADSEAGLKIFAGGSSASDTYVLHECSNP